MQTLIVIDSVELDVEFNYRPGKPAKVDGPWETSYPAQDAEVELILVQVNGINIFELLSEKALMQIESYIEENVDGIVRN
jgi:hypothetical protein